MILRSFCWWFLAYLLTRADADASIGSGSGSGSASGLKLEACSTLRNDRLLSTFTEELARIF